MDSQLGIGAAIEVAKALWSQYASAWVTSLAYLFIYTCAFARSGLGVSPRILLSLEREEDERDLRKRLDSLLAKCSTQQIELIHRVASVLIEP